MNKKIMWLMVGLVAAVLPAVAVADVMLTAYVHGSETSTGDAFTVQQGPNYANANALTGFSWVSQVNSEIEFLGSATIGFMSNETITEVNVLDINFTGLMGSATFSITVEVTSVFPSGSYIYISDTPQSLVNVPPGTNLAVSGSSVPLTFTVTDSSTIYIGFEVGSGAGGGTFQLNMALTET